MKIRLSSRNCKKTRRWDERAFEWRERSYVMPWNLLKLSEVSFIQIWIKLVYQFQVQFNVKVLNLSKWSPTSSCIQGTLQLTKMFVLSNVTKFFHLNGSWANKTMLQRLSARSSNIQKCKQKGSKYEICLKFDFYRKAFADIDLKAVMRSGCAKSYRKVYSNIFAVNISRRSTKTFP